MTDLFLVAERLMRDSAPANSPAPRAPAPTPIEAMARIKQFLLGRGTLEQQLELTGYWLTAMAAVVEAESRKLDSEAADLRALAAERRADTLERMLNPAAPEGGFP
jgi:hypothetical protein